MNTLQSRGLIGLAVSPAPPAQPNHFVEESQQSPLPFAIITPPRRYVLTGWSIARPVRVAGAAQSFFQSPPPYPLATYPKASDPAPTFVRSVSPNVPENPKPMFAVRARTPVRCDPELRLRQLAGTADRPERPTLVYLARRITDRAPSDLYGAAARCSAPPVVAPPPPPPPVPVQALPSVTPSTPFGNMVAPPVYSDPTPAPIPAAPLVASVPPPAVQPAAVPLGPVQPVPLPPPPGYAPVMPVAAIVPAGCEHLQIMPASLIAPVGSEMLLKANIPGRDGLLQSNLHVDWSIACNSVGQFTEMGFRDRGQLLGILEAPHKIDDWSATSSTAVVPITLNTGTPDPCDDIPIQRGEAWVTLSSATEGTTVVTAVAPWLDQYNQASATIHWIDAQWVFAQTAAVEAGRPHTLTTTVMRRTDGAPLPGWIVRYNVASGAALGYEGGNTIESTTDAAGRASVEVSPTNTSGGITNVGITIIRPATGGAIPMPRLELGRAATAITWGSAPSVPVTGAPALPPAPALPGTPIPPPPPSTFTPPPTAQPTPAPTAPPAAAPAPDPYAPTGKPRLEVTLSGPTPAQVAVGENVSFNLTVTNRGDGVAQHIKVSDRFDRGLRHPSASLVFTLSTTTACATSHQTTPKTCHSRSASSTAACNATT